MQEQIALKPTPLLGEDGGNLVPLAWRERYTESIPPRWEQDLEDLYTLVPDYAWGTGQFPVYLTSSNFDVGSLYAYRNTGNAEFLRIGTPVKCLEYLKARFGWGPNCLAVSHACVTAQLGIEMACRQLALGLARKVLVFSFDYISPFVAGGFHALKILNEQFPAPFEERETGSIGLGDGAGFVVLSREDSRCLIDSNFLYNEMYHFTANDPDGSGFLAGAEWLKRQVGDRAVWIKGHGTGTLEAGRLEAEAFQKILPNSPLVSWKGSLGHALGSCAIVEMALAMESINQGKAPGTVGSSLPSMTSNISLAPLDTRMYEAVALFSNAFGGAHAGCFVTYA